MSLKGFITIYDEILFVHNGPELNTQTNLQNILINITKCWKFTMFVGDDW